MSEAGSAGAAAAMRAAGHRATPRRLEVLRTLAAARRPLRVADLVARLSGSADQATVYRALEVLAEVGLARKVFLSDKFASYEATLGGAHHHHIVCRSCGRVEDVEACVAEEAVRQALRKAKRFAAVDSHSLEFFGICALCAGR